MDPPPLVYLITFTAIALRLLHDHSTHNWWFEYIPSLIQVTGSQASVVSFTAAFSYTLFTVVQGVTLSND